MSHGTEKSLADQQQQQQNQMQQQAFNTQQKTLSDLKTSLGGYLSGTKGFDPTQLAALKTQFLGQNASDFNQARSGVKSALASAGAGGGNMPVGGDYARGLSGLYGGEATNLSQGMTGISLQNLSQALSNQFNTASVLSGNAATLNSPISTFGAGASNALNQRIGIGMNSGLGAFTNSFLGGLGKGLGGAALGGLGGILSGIGQPSASGTATSAGSGSQYGVPWQGGGIGS